MHLNVFPSVWYLRHSLKNCPSWYKQKSVVALCQTSLAELFQFSHLELPCLPCGLCDEQWAMSSVGPTVWDMAAGGSKQRLATAGEEILWVRREKIKTKTMFTKWGQIVRMRELFYYCPFERSNKKKPSTLLNKILQIVSSYPRRVHHILPEKAGLGLRW